MDRRTFLRIIAAGSTAAFVEDLDRLLWVKEKTIFIPPADPWQKINDIIMEHIHPKLIDQVFASNPMFNYLRSDGKPNGRIKGMSR